MLHSWSRKPRKFSVPHENGINGSAPYGVDLFVYLMWSGYPRAFVIENSITVPRFFILGHYSRCGGTWRSKVNCYEKVFYSGCGDSIGL